MLTNNDTIVALATPAYKSAIHVIRISGSETYRIVNAIADRKITRVSNQITYGWIVDPDTKKRIDQVLFMKFISNHSYTGEDLIEINCHGGLYIVEQIISFLIKNGARLADRGEFTKRAFLNNKINLSQAISINDLINSDNSLAHDMAINNLRDYSNRLIKKWIEIIYNIVANFELAIDYPEYEEGRIDYEEIAKKLESLMSEINAELSNARQSQKIASGLKILLVGKTNVGKSSIFNLLVNESRSIVADIPGTTRNLVTEKINFNGFPVTFYDSAGIRESNDQLEILGISKSKEIIKSADLILVVLDATSFNKEDQYILKIVEESKSLYGVVINKIDLNKDVHELPKTHICTNALDNEISSLKNFLNDQITQLVSTHSAKVVGNFMIVRLENIVRLLKKIISDIKNKKYIDLLAIQLHEIHNHLLELTGDNKNFDLIEKLFNDFCVGK